ncbi:ribose 5-phosphate isomerase B [Spirochaetia bacterium]|nr:ribose 5-phosphate isomerase B [Spirochaetia bacterium]
MIALASDHGGFELKEAIKIFLDDIKIPYKDFGVNKPDSVDYAIIALPAVKAVASGTCEKGILFCGTGVGMSLAANKVKGIRCINCSEPFTAKLSREHNDANVLALGGRVVGVDLAKMIVKIWLETPFSGDERHKRRITQVMQIENP